MISEIKYPTTDSICKLALKILNVPKKVTILITNFHEILGRVYRLEYLV